MRSVGSDIPASNELRASSWFFAFSVLNLFDRAAGHRPVNDRTKTRPNRIDGWAHDVIADQLTTFAACVRRCG